MKMTWDTHPRPPYVLSYHLYEWLAHLSRPF